MEEKRKGEPCISYSVTCQVHVKVVVVGGNLEDEVICLGNLQMKKYRQESKRGTEDIWVTTRNGSFWTVVCVYMDDQLCTCACLCVNQLSADGQYVSFSTPAPCRPPHLDAS